MEQSAADEQIHPKVITSGDVVGIFTQTETQKDSKNPPRLDIIKLIEQYKTWRFLPLDIN